MSNRVMKNCSDTAIFRGNTSAASRVLIAALISGSLLLSTPPAFALVPLHTTPNNVKYADNGIKPATGRSGSASLQVRALIAKDLSTLVEATTGNLESGTKPGNIDKTQVKIFSSTLATQNYNNLNGGGYWSSTYAKVGRGTQVQVQANVSGIDPRRTDVVTVTAKAALRPDIRVDSVSGPEQAYPRAAVTFTAALSELNGDVGARSNCVLSVNGTQTAQANGIWVDAGGHVTCLFTQTFDQPGTYTIAVNAASVVPGDWDTSNNNATTTIRILSPGTPIQNGYMSADQDNYQYSNYSRDYWGNTWISSGTVNQSAAWLQGWDGSVFSGIQRVDATVSNNGNVNHTTSLIPAYTYNYDDGSYWQNCSQYYSQVWDSNINGYVMAPDFVSACSYGLRGYYAQSYYYYQLVSGTTVYYQYDVGWINLGTNTYGSGVDYGWSPGSTVRLQLNFVDSSGQGHTADQSVMLQDHSSDVNYNYTWGDWYQWGSNSASGTRAYGNTWW